MRGFPEVAANTATSDLVAFAERLRRRHAIRRAGQSALRALVGAGLGLLLSILLVPAAIGWTVALGLGVVVVATVLGWRAASAESAVAIYRGAGGTDAPAVVGDELVTWLEAAPRGGSDPMVGWLGRSLAVEVPPVADGWLQSVGRRRLGRFRWLLYLAVAAWLAFGITRFWQPPWAGVLGGGTEPPPPPPPSATQPGDGPPGGHAPEATDTPTPSATASVDPTKSPPSPPPPAALPPEPKDPEADTPPPPEPPAPLLELPGQQHFAVPEFIGDGETRRQRVHVAERPDEGGEAAGSAAAGPATPPTVPPPTAETFSRAAEAAQRARHVAPDERAIVERFFRLLREQGRR